MAQALPDLPMAETVLVRLIRISVVGLDPVTGATTFGVYGSHTYADEGAFYIGVTVDDVDGASAALVGTEQGGTAGGRGPATPELRIRAPGLQGFSAAGPVWRPGRETRPVPSRPMFSPVNKRVGILARVACTCFCDDDRGWWF